MGIQKSQDKDKGQLNRFWGNLTVVLGILSDNIDGIHLPESCLQCV